MASKSVCYKPYGDLESLPVSTYLWKDLTIYFMTDFPISVDWKGNNYNSILVIVDRLIKIVHYEPVKVMIDILGIAKEIINVIMHHHGVPESILTDQGLRFTLIFWTSLCYF